MYLFSCITSFVVLLCRCANICLCMGILYVAPRMKLITVSSVATLQLWLLHFTEIQCLHAKNLYIEISERLRLFLFDSVCVTLCVFCFFLERPDRSFASRKLEDW